MDWVQDKIQQARTKRWKHLDLGEVGLREIPREVFDLDALESLVLGRDFSDYDRNDWLESENQGAANQITVIPGEITRLINLTMLKLSGTRVSDLSPLQGLSTLVSLDLSGTQVSDLSPLQGLSTLVSLDLSGTQVSDLSPLQGLSTLVSLDLSGTRVSDLTPLRSLSTLTSLDLSGTRVSDLSPLQGLSTLTSLNLSGTELSDLSPLQGLSTLTSLNLSGTELSDLSPLQGLSTLTSLNLSGTELSDLSPLQGLSTLTSLSLARTELSDLSPLQGLSTLTSLNLNGTELSDLSPLQGLSTLVSLDLSGTQVSDLTLLRGLSTLTSLNLSGTQVSDLMPLQGLSTLVSLDLSFTRVSDLSPLQGLSTLTSLNLNGTEISDLSPLQDLSTLVSLNLNGTEISDLSPLQGLSTLTSLSLARTEISDLSPLQGLSTLVSLDLSFNPIHTFPDFVLALPHLHSLVLYGSPIRDVPPEILSSKSGANCLDAVLAHFADKTYGIALDREIKLILLGNGRVGKTSLVKRLVQNDFDPCEQSTHGIQLVPWDLSDQEEVLRINIWDFGGQDIYHGTHALFLRSRGVFLLVWDRDSAQQPGYDADGFHFEHFPLSYWLDYTSDASPESPVIVVENKCDDGTGTSPSVPVPGAQVNFSAKTGYGRDELTTLIRGACKRALTNAGARAIGVGRWQVKQTLLAYVSDDATRAPEDRRYRTLSYAHFQRLCEAQQGQVTSAQALLRYLHNTGVVYYQEDLFNNQIILDQRWAIEAIYTLFHRHHALHWLKRVGGRFRRSDLHELVWRDRSEAEQRLFLSFMESCALCFRLSDGYEDDSEYVAPELLPGKATYADEVALRRQERGEETIWYTYTQRFIHRSMMQRLMVRVGQMFRERALYWKDGVCIDVPGMQSMAIIDCERGIGGNPAQGRMTVEVRGRERHDLLNRVRNECERLMPHPQELWQAVSVDGEEWVNVAKLPDARILGSVVSEQRRQLDVHPFLFLLSKDPHDDLNPTAPYPAEKRPMPPAKGTIYLSYAWSDDQERGASREDIVNRLYTSLIADGYHVKRDKMDVAYKGLISEFMADIGRGDCVVVVISDKYLKSPYCMHELLAIYQNNNFRDRICPIVLADAKLRTLEDRLGYRVHWLDRLDHLEELMNRIGVRNLSKTEFQEFDMYREITQHHGTLARHLADINSQTPQLIEANDFEMLKRTIDERLQQMQ